MVKTVLNILGSALSIWQSKNAVKYQKRLMELEKAYDKENDKGENSDRNVLDHIERDIMRLSSVVSSEIRGSAAAPVQG